MSDKSLQRGLSSLGHAVEIEPLVIEDLAEIRYIHASAFRLIASSFFTEDEIAAFVETVMSVGYSDSLVAAMRDHRVIGARLGGDLVGTSGWAYAEDQGETARLEWLYVRPLFNRRGIGRRLVSETEAQVMRAGFRQIAARSTSAATGFFDHLGYRTTSHGVRALGGNVTVPVTFMRKHLNFSPTEPTTRH